MSNDQCLVWTLICMGKNKIIVRALRPPPTFSPTTSIFGAPCGLIKRGETFRFMAGETGGRIKAFLTDKMCGAFLSMRLDETRAKISLLSPLLWHKLIRYLWGLPDMISTIFFGIFDPLAVLLHVFVLSIGHSFFLKNRTFWRGFEPR